MLKKMTHYLKRLAYKPLPFLVATVGQGIVRLILWTCRWEVNGLERFKKVAEKQKCILMLWHNRLAIMPSILYKFASHLTYTAFVSNSRDGELISTVIHSYKIGKTIRVSHYARHQALRELIRYLEERKNIIIITPDGPRGPIYKIKPGVALAAMKTSAHVVPLTWRADHFWRLKTWDKLMIPKPFTTIRIFFEAPVILTKEDGIALHHAQNILQCSLPTP